MFLKCISCLCGKSFSHKKIMFRCACGGNPEIVLDYGKIKKFFSKEKLSERPFNQMRYSELYPVKPVTLFEGGTPLMRSKTLEKELGLKFELYFKNESVNPTGSFKDRGSSVEVSKAVLSGYKKAVCATTGNMGASVAAYSAIANLQSIIFTPKDARRIKLEQTLAYGAKVYHSKSEYTKVAEAAEYVAKKFNIFLLGDYMYRREGTKSIGLELSEQLNADYVFTPIGNGVLISSCWKGLNESKIFGISRTLPKMIGVQARWSSTIVRDLFKSKNELRRIEHPSTIAVAIEVGFPLDGNRALNAIKESRGFTQTVSDTEILKAKELLAKREGLYAEPAGAASLAGLIKSMDRIEPGSKVVCLVTGHGLKEQSIKPRNRPIETALNRKSLDKMFK